MKVKKTLFLVFLMSVIFSSCENTLANLLNEKMGFEVPETFSEEDKADAKKIKIEEKKQNDYNYIVISNAESFDDSLFDKYFRIYFTPVKGEEQKGSFCTYLPDSNVNIQTLSATNSSCGSIDSQGFFKIEKESPFVFKIADKEKQLASQYGLVFKYKGFSVNNVLSVEKDSFGEDEKNNNNILSDRTVVFEHKGSEWQKDIQISNYAVNQAEYHAGQYLEITVTGVPDADVNEILFDTYKNYPGETWYGTRLNGMENSTYLGLFNLRKGKQFNCTTLIKCAEDGNTNSSGIIMCYAFGTGDGWSSDWGWSTNQFDGQLTIKDFTISVRVYDNPLHWNIAYDPNLKKQTLYIDCDSRALPYFNTAYFDGWQGSDAPWTGHESEYSAVVFGNNIEVITNAFYLCGDGHTVDYIHLPANVKVLGINSFWSTRSLEQLYIPASVEYIGYHSFSKWSSCKQYLDWPESENSSRILTGLEYDNWGTYLNKQNHMTLTPVSEGVKINVDVSDLIVMDLTVVDLDTGTGISITPEYINSYKSVELIYPFCNANQKMCFQLHGNVKHSEYEDYSWFYEDVTVTSAGGVGPLNYSGFDQIKLNYTEEGERGRYLSAADFTVDNISLMFSNFLNGSTYMENLYTELRFVSGKTDWSNGTFWLTGMQNDLQYLQEDCLTYKLLDGQKVDIFESGLWWDNYTAAEFNNKLSQNPTLYFGMLIGFRLSNYNNKYIQNDNGSRIYACQFITKELQFEYDYTPVIFNSYDSGNGYSFSNGTLTITDSVDADFFNNKSFSAEDVTTLNIHNNVQTIPSGLFTNCKNLEAVNVSSPLKTIESGAFLGLTKLNIVNIPDSVESIGDRAFYDCSSLEYIVIPKNTVTIGDMAFASSGIKIILVQENVQRIGTGAFQNCSSLEVVYIHENSKLQSFSSNLFYNCESLYQVVVYIEAETYYSSGFKITSYCWNDMGTIGIPSSINEIDYRAFYNCKNLTQVNISSSVTSISSEAFLGTGITSVIIPTSVTTIGSNTFNSSCLLYVDWSMKDVLVNSTSANIKYINIKGELSDSVSWKIEDDVLYIEGEGAMPDYNLSDYGTASWRKMSETYSSVVVKDGITAVGNYAFYNTRITSVTIPASVKTIGERAFKYCSSLTTLEFEKGSNCEQIGEGAFDYTGITSVTIPSSVKTIGDYAFNGSCLLYVDWSMKDVLVNSTSAYIKYINIKGELSDSVSWKIEDGVLYIEGEGAMPDFNSSDNDTAPWRNMSETYSSVVVKDGITAVGNYAFCNTGITSVTIPSSVKTIGDYAFYYCSSLTTLEFEKGSNCEQIGNWAFCDTGITSVTIPSSVKTIVDGAFHCCPLLTVLEFEENSKCEQIGNDAFRYAGITSVTIPASVKTIGGYAFDDSSLTVLEFEEGSNCEQFGDCAFSNCSELSAIDLSKCGYLNTIGSNAFSGCYALVSVDLSGCTKLASVGGYAFGNTSNGQTVVLGFTDTVFRNKKFSDDAFGNATLVFAQE